MARTQDVFLAYVKKPATVRHAVVPRHCRPRPGRRLRLHSLDPPAGPPPTAPPAEVHPRSPYRRPSSFRYVGPDAAACSSEIPGTCVAWRHAPLCSAGRRARRLPSSRRPIRRLGRLFGAGLALTSGNAGHSNVNLDAQTDPRPAESPPGDGRRRSTSRLQRGRLDRPPDGVQRPGRIHLDRPDVVLRPVPLPSRQFKAIEYLVAPTAGLAYKLSTSRLPSSLSTPAAAWSWEGNTGQDTSTSGALTLSETFSAPVHRHGRASRTRPTGLWKTSDFGDSLYTVAAVWRHPSRSARAQGGVSGVVQEPASARHRKGDLSFLTTLVYTF